ncbi:MAG: precorrin-8X methylmutase [Deltaproteobacteria bacterium]|nr:precorrin-8X methylmutase [Deltaproteobacteria bacterium]
MAPDTGEEIYKKSVTIIDSLLKDNLHFNNFYSEAERVVIKRVIHATSDVSYAGSIFFTNNSVQKGMNLIKKKIEKKEPLKIVCDSEMTKAGISKNINKNVIIDSYCYIGWDYDSLLKNWENLICRYKFLHDFKECINNPDITNITKSALSIRLATTEKLPDVIAIGNAPTALIEVMNLCKYLHRSINYNPPIIIAMPVGFVGAAESKKLLYEDNFYSSIGNFGNFGGSSSAASAVNALLSGCL